MIAKTLSGILPDDWYIGVGDRRRVFSHAGSKEADSALENFILAKF